VTSGLVRWIDSILARAMYVGSSAVFFLCLFDSYATQALDLM
jgi:hypothetical protein